MLPFRGQVVPGDGSAYTAPLIDPQIVENVEYIPHDLALGKLRTATSNFVDLKSKYEEHISQIKTFHESKYDKTKTFYEECIKDLKAKGLQHASNEKKMRLRSEERLKAQTKDLEASVENLRDTLANLRVEHKEAVAALKEQISKLEGSEAQLRGQLDDFAIRTDCANALRNILIDTELEGTIYSYEQRILALESRIVGLIGDYENRLLEAEKRYAATLAEQQESKTIETECRIVLLSVTADIEQAEQLQQEADVSELKARHQQTVDAALQLVAEGKRIIEELQESTRQQLRLAAERSQFLSEDYLSGIVRYAMQGEQARIATITDLEREIAVSKKRHVEAIDRCNHLEVELSLKSAVDSTVEKQMQHSEEEATKAKNEVQALTSQLNDARATVDSMNKTLHSLQAQSYVKGVLSQVTSDVCVRTAGQRLEGVLQEKLKKSNNIQAKALEEKFQDYKTRTEVRLCLTDVVSSVCDRHAAVSIPPPSITRSAAALGMASTRGSTSMPTDHIPVPALGTQEQATQTTDHTDSSPSSSSATTAADGVAAVAGVVASTVLEVVHLPSKPVISSEVADQIAAEQDRVNRLDELKAQLAVLIPKLEEAQERLSQASREKNDAKVFIKKWVDNFEKENGRPPAKEDKEAIKDYYKTYKTGTMKNQEFTDIVKDLQTERELLEKQIAELESRGPSPELLVAMEAQAKYDRELIEAQQREGATEAAASTAATTATTAATAPTQNQEEDISDVVPAGTTSVPVSAVAEVIPGTMEGNEELRKRIVELEEEIHQLKTTATTSVVVIAPQDAAGTVDAADAGAAVVSPAAVAVILDAAAQGKLDELKAELSVLEPQFDAEKSSYADNLKEKNESKIFIKKWVRNFEQEYGRQPAKEDKEEIKIYYQTYKFSSKKVEDSIGPLTEKHKRKYLLTHLIKYLRDGGVLSNLDTVAADIEKNTPAFGEDNEEEEAAAAATVAVAVVGGEGGGGKETQDAAAEGSAESATEGESTGIPSSEAAAAPSSEPVGPRAEDLEIIEKLEDSLYQVQQELAEAKALLDKTAADKDFIAIQMEALIKEKRTDIVKRYENEIAALKASEAALTENLTIMKTEKTKNELKLKELQERAERSELDIKERDERERRGVPPNEEKAVLRVKIAKQTEEIVLKAKAATAGWDAAADADERLEIDVDKAYRKGMQEGRQVAEADKKAMNKALEDKEVRITDLLVQMHTMEFKVKEAEERTAASEEAYRVAKVEAAETIASFGGGGSGGGASDAELDAARDELDAAQDEIVQLSEKCESLSSSLEIAQQKMAIFEQMVNAANNSAKARAASNTFDNAGGGGGGGDRSEITDLLATLKNVATKGATLWKNNRKDECYDLYMKTCEDAANKLRTPQLKNPLLETTVQGKQQGSVKKERGAVQLRKAIDRLIADLQQPANKRAEEEAAFAMVSHAAQASDDAVTSGLKAQLAILERQEQAINRNLSKAGGGVEKTEDGVEGETKEDGGTEAPAEGAAAAATTSGSDSSGGASAVVIIAGGAAKPLADEPKKEPLSETIPASSLLKRAKAAEAKVELLKKQLAMFAQQSLDGGLGQAEGQSQSGGQVTVEMTEGDGLAAGAEATTDGAASSTAVTGASEKLLAANVGAAKAAATGKGAVAKAGAATAATATSATTAATNPAELRKLQRRVKELEGQLESAMNSGGGGGGDKKAADKLEKQLNKKIKELETSHRKEKTSLEGKLAKAEATLETATASLPLITEERDRLRTQVKELTVLTEDLEKYKIVAARALELEELMLQKQKEMDLLQEQFKKETALRKKYKNELEDLKGAIRVYARCRPMAAYEIERGSKKVVDFLDESRMKIQSSRGEKEYEFDAAFSQLSTQDQVFEDTKRLVESFMDGFNVCLFAYGQTGSGKTFTMTGSPDNPGLTPKAINEIYRLIAERAHCVCKVTSYFVELYNDNLVDLYWLLDNKKISNAEPPKLDIKVDNRKMVYIRNSKIKEASSAEELMELFRLGNEERHVGATKMNAESSRSHSIFSIMVESYDTATKRTIMGKLSLVDLAGSERADKTGASAERLREAQSINKSLSALGDVIAALSEGEKFIPYRNNKLTQLMQDSLGGNAKTLMFVNFSPADYNCDETVTSLNYATRVKKIVNSASKQAESEQVSKLKAIIKRLQAGATVAADELEGAVEEEEEQPAPQGQDYYPNGDDDEGIAEQGEGGREGGGGGGAAGAGGGDSAKTSGRSRGSRKDK